MPIELIGTAKVHKFHIKWLDFHYGWAEGEVIFGDKKAIVWLSRKRTYEQENSGTPPVELDVPSGDIEIRLPKELPDVDWDTYDWANHQVPLNPELEPWVGDTLIVNGVEAGTFHKRLTPDYPYDYEHLDLPAAPPRHTVESLRCRIHHTVYPDVCRSIEDSIL